MEMSYKLKDTEQTKRMKDLAMGGVYFNCGEIYKLLEYEELHNLVKKIKKGTIKLDSDLVYNKFEITNEEKFLENLDHYITYIKNNYHIRCVEQLLLIEFGLDNRYAEKCLLSLEDFHSSDNCYEYFNYFRRMFLYNIFNNILYFHSKDKNREYRALNRAYNDIKKIDFDNDKDILFLEQMVLEVIDARNDNLYNAFDSYAKIKRKEQKSFYIHQLDWILQDYYSTYDKNKYKYKIKKTDNIIKLEYMTILFNIKTNFKKCNENEKVEIEFGIFNNLINSKTDNIFLTKEEFETMYGMLDGMLNRGRKYREVLSFVDSTLRFDFDYAGKDNFLDIIYVLPNCGGDFYDISVGTKDVVKFFNMIKKQIDF